MLVLAAFFEGAVRDLIERLAERLNREPQARDVMGDKFRALPPAPEHAVLATETRLRFALPRTLRRIYLEVANGGFGPGYGVMGADGGFTDDLGQTVADLYLSYREPYPEDPAWQWPEFLLPICHWGCIVYSAVDCSREENPVYMADVGGREPGDQMESIIELHRTSLDSWIGDWLDGVNLWRDFYSEVGGS
jgi:hypothetical protein